MIVDYSAYNPPFKLVGEYANILAKFGPNTAESMEFRDRHSKNHELIELCDSLERIRRNLRGESVRKPKMKLYVWNKDVFRDHGSGIAFAVAGSEDEARRLIADVAGFVNLEPELGSDCGLLAPADETHELDKPYAAYLYGSM